MARDCPDRQRGANWRNDAPGGAMPGARPAGRIGGGDDVDREYEVCPLNVPLHLNFLTAFAATYARAFW